jgi:hypothetical protein
MILDRKICWAAVALTSRQAATLLDALGLRGREVVAHSGAWSSLLRSAAGEPLSRA